MKNDINKSIKLDAPVETVWHALTNYSEFGTWFQVDLNGPFEVGKVTEGILTYQGCEGLPFWVRVESMDAPKHFSFAWPMDETVNPDDPDIDQKITLVEFALESIGSGTVLQLRESGFAKLPDSKRVQIFRGNDDGWDIQMKHIERHVS